MGEMDKDGTNVAVQAKAKRSPSANIRSIAVVLSALSHAVAHRDEDGIVLACLEADELVRRTQ